MRFFKHGDALAIVLPDALRKSSGVKENDEYHWYEAEPGVFVLASTALVNDLVKRGAFLDLARRVPANVSANASAPAYKVNPVVSSTSTPAPYVTRPASTYSGAPSGDLSKLRQAGFLVLESEFDAKRFSEQNANSIKSGEIMGLRGFDKKFYLLTLEYYNVLAPRIVDALKEGATPLSTIVRATKASEPATQAVLLQLKERGDVIEKKKGVFAFVG